MGREFGLGGAGFFKRPWQYGHDGVLAFTFFGISRNGVNILLLKNVKAEWGRNSCS